MRVILSLFLSCLLLGLLASIGNSQLVASGQGILSPAQGTVGNSLPGAPTLTDALTSILGPILSGNNGNNTLVGNLTTLLNRLQTVSLSSLLNGILNGNLDELEKILGPVVELLQNLPIVGPLIILLSQILRIPLTLVTSIVALLLQLLIVLLNITRVTSG